MRHSARSESASSQEHPLPQPKIKVGRRRNTKGSAAHNPTSDSGSHSQQSLSSNKQFSQGVSPRVKVSPMRESLSKLSFPPSMYSIDQSVMENSFLNQTALTSGDVAETFRAQVLAACQVTTTISPSVTTALLPDMKPQTLTPLIEAFSLEHFQIPDLCARPPPSETVVNTNGDIAEAFRAQVLAACAAKEAHGSSMDDLVSAISSDPMTGAITANESPNIVPLVFITPTMDPVIVDSMNDMSFGDPPVQKDSGSSDCPITPPIVPSPLNPMSGRLLVSAAKLLPVITPPSPKSPQSEDFEIHADVGIMQPCDPITEKSQVSTTQDGKENDVVEPFNSASPDTPKVVCLPPDLVAAEETLGVPTDDALPDEPAEGTLCPRNSVVDPPSLGPTIYESILSSPKKILGGGQIVMDIIDLLSPRAQEQAGDEDQPQPFSLFSSSKKQGPGLPTTGMEDELVTSFVSEEMTSPKTQLFTSDPITEKVLDEIIETIMHEQAVVASPPLPVGDEENPVGMIVKLSPEVPVETAPTT